MSKPDTEPFSCEAGRAARRQASEETAVSRDAFSKTRGKVDYETLGCEAGRAARKQASEETAVSRNAFSKAKNPSTREP